MENSPVAIVTGAAQGIGAAICVALLKQGYRVCVADIKEDKGKEFVYGLQKEFGENKAIFSFCDVSEESNYDTTFELVLNTFHRIDVLINNAGITLEQDPKKVIAINLLGPIYGCQAAFRYMGKTNGGSGGVVINTSSAAGFVAIPQSPAYTASKHGVIGMTRSYGSSYHFKKEGILFSAICPSFTDTELLKQGGINVLFFDHNSSSYPSLMSPEYVAEGVLKILEDRINGSALLITKENGFQYIGIQEVKGLPMLRNQNAVFPQKL